MDIPDKPSYKISEVCQYTDTQPYVLRFWESEFPELASQKSRSGQRVYTRKDIDLVLKIKKLLYEEEFTIAGARKHLEDELSGRAVEAPAHEAGRGGKKTGSRKEAEAREKTTRAEGAGAGPLFAETAPAEGAEDQGAAEMEELRQRAADAEQRRLQSEADLEKAQRAIAAYREASAKVADRLESLLRSLGVSEEEGA